MKTALIAIAAYALGLALGAWFVLARLPDGFPDGMGGIPMYDATGVVQGISDSLTKHCKRRGQRKVLMVLVVRDGKPYALSADCKP